MKHNILVNFNQNVKNKESIMEDIAILYNRLSQISGIHGAKVLKDQKYIDKDYDCMIVVDMEAPAKSSFYCSETNKLWRKDYSRFIKHQAVVEC